MIDFVKDEEFSFWLPMEIAKADPKDKKSKRRIVQGIASTTDEDLQKEVVEQRGIDFSYFLKYGYYNNDHKPGFENKVGQPLECRVTKDGLWTKGFLFSNHKIADSIWELANALDASQADRKLGFSIQGKVTRRAGRRIMRCWIQDIAITAAPINTNTWLDVVKSLSSLSDEYFCDDSSCFYVSPRQISPVHKSRCGKSCVKNMDKVSKIFTGLAIDEEKMDLRKDVDEKQCSCGKKHDDSEKAFTQAGSGAITTPESLEGEEKDQEWANKAQEVANKSLQFDECVDLLCEFRGLARPDAAVVAEAVFEMNNKVSN
jgi:hypothetical protein